jgi:DNA topoisomerase-3
VVPKGKSDIIMFELLRGSAPALVDPGTTALWEMRLDEIVTGKTDFRNVIDGVPAAANGLIEARQGQSSQKVNLQNEAQARGSEQRRYRRSNRSRNTEDGRSVPSPRRSRTSRSASEKVTTSAQSNQSSEVRGRRKPTAKMVAYAQMLARSRNAALPDNYQRDFDVCRRFLDEHAK